MRRRDERSPDRLPRVGERPAGADRGLDLAMLVLILAADDLGFRWDRDRGVEAALGVLFSEILPVVADLVRKKDDGLTKESLDEK